MAQCPGAQRLNGKTFFGLQPYLAGRCCDNPQTTRGPAHRKFGPEITWLVGVTIYCTMFQLQFTSTSPVFTRKIIFEKINQKKSLLHTLLNLN